MLEKMNIDMSRLASIDIIVETIRVSCDISLYCTYISYSAFILFDRPLDQMGKVVSADTPLKGDDIVSWAAYHADQQLRHPDPGSSVALRSLLPLFYDQAKSVAMIRHSMDVIKRAVDILNPSQIPIITVDQPLYTLAKQIQWRWPETHGEDRFVILFGGLHIEMAALKTLGNLLDGSGWTSALVQAGVATPGTADSFLKAAQVTRTRRARYVTASTLHILRQEAYTKYVNELEEGRNQISLEEWCKRRGDASPQFKFWSIILQLELEVLIYVRSIRDATFLLYVDSLTKIVPWFFALDHTNYARWIPIHLRDTVSLDIKHPDVFAQFLAGNFAVKMTTRAFSVIAIDQAHEQNNATVKGDGGAVGLTENPAAMRRWMVSGPEMSRVIREFQASADNKTHRTGILHHEQTKHAQMVFVRYVKSLHCAMGEMGNPFCDESNDLLVLDNGDVADPVIITALRQMEVLGQEQYERYVEERLVNRTKPIADPIKRNNLSLVSRPPVRKKSKAQLHLSSINNDCSLFSRLYIASHVRDGDLDAFFEHDNQACPPALSQVGNIRLGKKYDLEGCLEDLIHPRDNASSPAVEVVILDGAAIVNMLAPGTTKTFSEYATQVFLPYATSQLQHASRVDVVFDEYLPDSLKAATRKKRERYPETS